MKRVLVPTLCLLVVVVASAEGVMSVKDRLAADLDRLKEDLAGTNAETATESGAFLADKSKWGWFSNLNPFSSKKVAKPNTFTKKVTNYVTKTISALDTWACARRYKDDIIRQWMVTFVGAGKCASKNGAPCILIGVTSQAVKHMVSIPTRLREGDGCTYEIRVIPTPQRGVPIIKQGYHSDVLISADDSSAPVPTLNIGDAMYSYMNKIGWAVGTAGALLKDQKSGDVYVLTNAHVVIDPQCIWTDNEKYCMGRCAWQKSIEMCHSSDAIGSVHFGEKVPDGMSPKHSTGDIVFVRYDDYADMALVKLSKEMAAKVRNSFENEPSKHSKGLHHLIGKNYYTKQEQSAVGWRFWQRAFWQDHRRSWDDLIESSVEGKLTVFKDGQTTDYTKGTIDAYGEVLPDANHPKKRSYREQLMVDTRGFADKGDSGSGVYDANTNELIGLLWGGTKEQTFVTPMNHVMDTIREWQEDSGVDLRVM